MNLSFVKRFFDAHKAYRRVYNELMMSSDRELRELGIERADIPRIATQAAREA